MKPVTEAVGYENIGRGAFHPASKARASGSGADGKANVGISNDKEGAIPPAERPRFPEQRQSVQGESVPKHKPKGEGDGSNG